MLLERSSDTSEDVGSTIFGRSKVVQSIYQLAVREYLLSPFIALRKKKSISLTKALKICDFHVPDDAICFPPKFASDLFSNQSNQNLFSNFAEGTTVNPKRRWKTLFAQNFMGKPNCIMGNVKIANYSSDVRKDCKTCNN